MNDKSFTAQEFSGNRNIDGKPDADKLILILKPTGGVMVAEKTNSDENESSKDRISMKKLCNSTIYLVVAILSIALSLWISPPMIGERMLASEMRESFAEFTAFKRYGRK